MRVAPVVADHRSGLIPPQVALALSMHGELTLACRTVMQLTQEIAKTGVTRHILR